MGEPDERVDCYAGMNESQRQKDETAWKFLEGCGKKEK
jgi:hypothetical protein